MDNFTKIKREYLEGRYNHLNEEQRRAVFAVTGPVLIFAGAGSGKTTVLSNRIEYMVKYGNSYNSEIKGDEDKLREFIDSENFEEADRLISANKIRPYSILAITFTNKAAKELAERIERRVGPMGRDVQACTFHSACLRILRREIELLGFGKTFTIYDTDDSVRVIKAIMADLRIDNKIHNPKAILGAISKAKDAEISPDSLEAGYDAFNQVVKKIYPLYQKRLFSANAVDFDDILRLVVELFRKFPEVLEKYRQWYSYILVDEYQDTNHLQYSFISLLAGGHKNLCVVGDDDQSIYRFRGADIENILNFEREFKGANVIKLEQNYRSVENILEAANGVIKNNEGRVSKKLWSDLGTGEKVLAVTIDDEFAEGNYIADTIEEGISSGKSFNDFTILYRMNAQSQAVERTLSRRAIPYKIVGGVRFFERKEIKDMMAYLSIIDNHADNLRLRRIINEPKRGIGITTIERAEEIAINEGVSLLSVFRNAENYEGIIRAREKLQQFCDMLDLLTEQKDKIPLDELFELLLEKSEYLKQFENGGIEGETRSENVRELLSNIKDFIKNHPEPTLSSYLEEMALYTDLDNYNESEERVTLMTMHGAKGLEFNTVFICGMEDGIFPGTQSLFSQEDMEEERRLAYVGITRAKRELHLLSAKQRMIFGRTQRNKPSRFIEEIPPQCIQFADKSRAPIAPSFKRTEKVVNRGFSGAPTVRPTASAAPSERYSVGETVYSKAFGQGVVTESREMGGDTLLTVNFKSGGSKKLMANFAKLTKNP